MKQLFISIILLACFSSQAQIPLVKARTYKTNIFNDGGTEILAWDRTTKRLYSTNGSLNQLEILGLDDITKPQLIASVDLSPYMTKVNSVDVNLGTVAVVGEGSSPQTSGKVVFFDKDGVFQNQLSVGPLPDMITFTPGGNKVMIANEGEPTDDYTSDPAGSISVIDLSFGVNNITQSSVITIPFTPLDSQAIHPLIRIYGNNGQQKVSQDLEPEYITVKSDLSKAYVSLQENNAIMVIDINTNTIDTVIGLGYIDRGISGNGIDASDVNPSIDIATYPRLLGMFQPDAITAFDVNGQTYIASANEGDSRTYTAYNEEARVKTQVLDPAKFPNSGLLATDNVLGRLNVTTSMGDNNGDGLIDSLFTFGTRSFSIWSDSLTLIWDSGDDFEQTIATAYPNNFNSNHNDNNSYKDRSDDKGPEPEAITTGEVDGVLYAFVGLERMGGIMIYDISDPTNPQFVMYELNRDFNVTADNTDAGDLGTESIVFIPASESPTGIALLITGNEISGTITIYEIGIGIGLDEPLNAGTLKAFPNPSTDVVNFNQYGDYMVYDTNGRLIEKTENVNSISLSNQAEGLYIVKDKEGNTLRVIKKNQ
jgi:hypothetical protein